MERIKIVKRIGLPETNSSSSHSVSIAMSGKNLITPEDPDYNLDIRDGILYIPGEVNFGWEYFKYNTPLEKLQYICGIYCSDVENKKRIYHLKKILKEILGVKDVVFEWVDKYYEKIKNGEDPEDIYYGCPEIDHNSNDIFEEIIENKETIRNFIFSRDSWLFGGNDNSDYSPGFFGKSCVGFYEESPEALLSINLGGKFGRIDFEIPIFPITTKTDFIYDIMHGSKDMIGLKDFCWIPREKRFDLINEYVLQTEDPVFSINTIFPYFYDLNTGETYLVFSGSKFRDEYVIEKHKVKDILDDYIRNNKTEYYIEKNKLGLKTLRRCEKDIDYILVPITITLLKYQVNV